MKFLEEKRCVHRDLRASNILVGEENLVKLADFGLSRSLAHTDTHESLEAYETNDTRFPQKWAAPECFPENFSPGKCYAFTIKSDVWSFGIVIYEVVTFGASPYPSMFISIKIQYNKIHLSIFKVFVNALSHLHLLDWTNEVTVPNVLHNNYKMPNPDGESFREHHPHSLPSALQGHKVYCPERLYSIMAQCWKRNPEQRPTFEHLNALFDNFERL